MEHTHTNFNRQTKYGNRFLLFLVMLVCEQCMLLLLTNLKGQKWITIYVLTKMNIILHYLLIDDLIFIKYIVKLSLFLIPGCFTTIRTFSNSRNRRTEQLQSTGLSVSPIFTNGICHQTPKEDIRECIAFSSYESNLKGICQ